ncbi:oligosaccharide flippase family protein, partial [Oceanicola granulosus]|uniref:oligosaccharide flippase family protein n=1 Tax=Oceanicola granulosus TaxID=252302 RepID=UPI00178C7767
MLTELRSLLFASTLLAALSYATNIFLANRLGPSEFGQYSYALLLGMAFAQFVSFGTDEAGVRLRSSYGMEAMDWVLTTKFLNFAIICTGALAASFLRSDPLVLYAVVVAINGLSYVTSYEVKRRN